MSDREVREALNYVTMRHQINDIHRYSQEIKDWSHTVKIVTAEGIRNEIQKLTKRGK
tara:strand:- start:240 stop:410 length:171 start_codon:yes stop_codon:yes gene_type:complete